MFRYAWEAFVLFLVAFFLAFGYRQVAHPPLATTVKPTYPTFSFSNSVTYQALLNVDLPDTVLLQLPEAKVIFDSGWAIFVDARPPEAYRSGHIPGALNLPYNAVDQNLEVLVQIPVDTPVIVYCGGAECEASLHLMRNLKQMGYRHVLVFFGGWKEWENAGYPVVREEGP